MRRFTGLLLVLCALFAIAQCAKSTQFCKCTCFTNSTIIPLNGIKTDDKSSLLLERVAQKQGTCNDCNRQFCIDYNLPICKGATVDDVFTTCFQRDSVKDEAVVFIFIFATVGLLIWAGIRPYAEKWMESARGRRQDYAPVAGDSAQ